MEIPCAHELVAIIKNRNTLTDFIIHPQWDLEWSSTGVRAVNLVECNLFWFTNLLWANQSGKGEDFWRLMGIDLGAGWLPPGNRTREGDYECRRVSRWPEHCCLVQTAVFEPTIRGRSVGAKYLPKNSTKRDASWFEHKEGHIGKRRCAEWRLMGHNRCSCHSDDSLGGQHHVTAHHNWKHNFWIFSLVYKWYHTAPHEE